MLKTFYNVYDNGKLVLENAYAEDVGELVGNEKLNIHYYVRNHFIYKGRYRIEKADSELARSVFAREWNEAIAPFKRVIWVKSGGRKLGGY